ncbi:helix-turn-helix domain-containing protein [Micromonospora arida]|uniref:Helix-turn-helix transcriptional regulator n=1 Tax=Micromonospora zamorensis TaxID=709883 RepID=A0ABZ1PHN3_9ACTN|nr:helix-turn-helix transcriptional regulator [Micromonospora zamorensis]
MKWNLRLTAANAGIWKASEMQRLLAERGLVISAGKMSNLWSGQPISLKLSDLDVICAVLDCGVADLLKPEPVAIQAVQDDTSGQDKAVGETAGVTPRPRSGRSLPPV